MKGIGPNNLGMSKMAGSDCCGIPSCSCGYSAPKSPAKIAPLVAALAPALVKGAAGALAGKLMSGKKE